MVEARNSIKLVDPHHIGQVLREYTRFVEKKSGPKIKIEGRHEENPSYTSAQEEIWHLMTSDVNGGDARGLSADDIDESVSDIVNGVILGGNVAKVVKRFL